LERQIGEVPAVEVEVAFQDMLRERRGRDAETGGAADGPHRSDLAVWHGDKQVPAAQCSTGEQKALLISIQLANARLETSRRGVAPLLLLDEIAAHLDEGRRLALFGELRALGAQIWLTGTDKGTFAPLAPWTQCYRVRDGQVTEEEW
jgi:DNA replication and repair protein RecF